MRRSMCCLSLLFFALWCSTGRAADAAGPERPNVLVIISDDQGWADYGFMGHPHIATPRLDRLAGESLLFTRGYSPVPLCRPSLATIATGLYPHVHGVTGNDPDLPDKAAKAMAERQNPKFARFYQTIIKHFAQRPNFVRDLTGRGYSSLETGKWWEGDPVKTAGFSHAMTKGEAKGSRHGDAGLEIGRNGLEPIYNFLKESQGKPWLVWYAPMLPHAPHTAPAALFEKYRRMAPSEPVARYWASVEWFDQTCGELLDHLERTGQRRKTIVVYTTDNGWIQDPDKANRPAARSKLSPYEGGVRTPIMISWPGHIEPRRDDERLASNIDLWPTLAALLQTPLPSGLPGVNLTDAQAVAARRRIFGEQYSHNIADVDEPTRSLQSRFIIDGWWKLIVHEAGKGPAAAAELYDLRADPWEKADQSTGQPDRVAKLRQVLDGWWTPVSSK